jgi:hypothetical protein
MEQVFKYLISLFFSCILWAVGISQADSAVHRHRVAVFIPLYLDSAFDASGNYRYDKNFPKFLNSGLEFYEGMELALDTLRKENLSLDVEVYDTRKAGLNLPSLLESPDFQPTELIIAHVEPAELRLLANTAAQKNIPFINVNFPNDAGISNNPYFVILNSTLRAHCESLYRFLQRNYPLWPMVIFRKNGTQEDRLQHYWEDIGKSTSSVPLKLHFVSLGESVDPHQLIPYLDSTKKTICVVASLDESFGKSVCSALASLNKTYVTKIFGTPTWDDIADFGQPEFADQEIYYTSPFYINPADSLAGSIQQYFHTRFYSRPSDMVYRGYESMYHFAKLLNQFGSTIASNIGSKLFRVFTDFDIEPVFLNRENMTLDYFENRKVYFIKKVNGNVVAVY